MTRARARGRRIADITFALATWAAATASALWFYDWINRWYVAVPLVTVFVLAMMRTGHLTPVAGHEQGVDQLTA